jgi:hypothetical protein
VDDVNPYDVTYIYACMFFAIVYGLFLWILFLTLFEIVSLYF